MTLKMKDESKDIESDVELIEKVPLADLSTAEIEALMKERGLIRYGEERTANADDDKSEL